MEWTCVSADQHLRNTSSMLEAQANRCVTLALGIRPLRRVKKVNYVASDRMATNLIIYSNLEPSSSLQVQTEQKEKGGLGSSFPFSCRSQAARSTHQGESSLDVEFRKRQAEGRAKRQPALTAANGQKMISAGFEPATSSVSPNDPSRPELLRRRANQLRQETVEVRALTLHI